MTTMPRHAISGTFTRRFCDCGCRREVNSKHRFVSGHGISRQQLRCACGCGERILWKPHYKYRRPRYIRFHRARGVDHTKKPPRKWKRPSGFCECGCGQRTALARQTNIKLDHYRGYPLHFVTGHNKRMRKITDRTPYRLALKNGYILVKKPECPMSSAQGYVLEHRLVMSEVLGRPLIGDEYVHHRNGNRADNAPGNLELWAVRKDPPGQRVADLVRWAHEILDRYSA